MPSRPMLTTPARSENSPPSAGQPDRDGEQQRGRHRRGRRQRLLAADRPDGGERRTAAEHQPEQPPLVPPPVSRSVSGPRLGRAPGVWTTCSCLAPRPSGRPSGTGVRLTPARCRHGAPSSSTAGRVPCRRPPGRPADGWALPRSAARRVTRRAISLAMTTASTIVPWKIVTTDAGKSAICSGTSDRSRKANSRAAKRDADRACCGPAAPPRCRGSPARR